jgi:hypothetical protein
MVARCRYVLDDDCRIKIAAQGQMSHSLAVEDCGKSTVQGIVEHAHSGEAVDLASQIAHMPTTRARFPLLPSMYPQWDWPCRSE